MFCPWESLHRVGERPPWLGPPGGEPAPDEEMPEGPWPGESYYVREAAEQDPEPAEGRREPSARTLERVVPVGQKRSVGGATVAISGEVEVLGLPEGGELVVNIPRLEIESYGSEEGPLRGTPLEGPWGFRFWI